MSTSSTGSYPSSSSTGLVEVVGEQELDELEQLALSTLRNFMKLHRIKASRLQRMSLKIAVLAHLDDRYDQVEEARSPEARKKAATAAFLGLEQTLERIRDLKVLLSERYKGDRDAVNTFQFFRWNAGMEAATTGVAVSGCPPCPGAAPVKENFKPFFLKNIFHENPANSLSSSFDSEFNMFSEVSAPHQTAPQVPDTVVPGTRSLATLTQILPGPNKAGGDNMKIGLLRPTSLIPRYGVIPTSGTEMHKLMSRVDKWGLDVFSVSEITSNRPLTAMAYTLFNDRDLFNTFQIPKYVALNYFALLEAHYRKSNPYHNSIHAADVMQCTHVALNARTLKHIFSDLQIMATLFAAAIHDVDHPGFTNQFLINNGSELAVLYNDIAVLENHHLAVGFKLLQSRGCDLFRTLSVQQRKELRTSTVISVLGTDMARHGETLMYLGNLISNNLQLTLNMITLTNHQKLKLLEAMVHCCDLSNVSKPIPLYREWTDRLMEEFFHQGDVERSLRLDVSAMCDRATVSVVFNRAQVGFIDYVVKPLWMAWAKLVKPDADHVIEQMLEVREHCRAAAEQQEAADKATVAAEIEDFKQRRMDRYRVKDI